MRAGHHGFSPAAGWRLGVVAAALLVLLLATGCGAAGTAAAQTGRSGSAANSPSVTEAALDGLAEAVARLEPRYRQWLQTVSGLITAWAAMSTHRRAAQALQA